MPFSMFTKLPIYFNSSTEIDVILTMKVMSEPIQLPIKMSDMIVCQAFERAYYSLCCIFFSFIEEKIGRNCFTRQ